jgi:ketosteroid isomerase-like protein
MTNIEARLKVIEDENQIRALAHSFADICISGDTQGFEKLWIEDGIWTLAEPLNMESRGRNDIAKLFHQLATGKRFFCQKLHSGIVKISGDTATTRWILSESAANDDGSLYQSTAIYDDQLLFADGRWLFQSRYCKFLDISYTGNNS